MLLTNVKTVLFYSFKGGVGRTQTMLNSAKHLSNSGKKVLMVDFDLYAPGLSYWKVNSIQKQENEIYFLNFIVNDFNAKDDKKEIYRKKINDNLHLIPVYDMSNIGNYHKLLVELSAFLFDIKKHAQDKISSTATLSDAILDTFVKRLVDNEEYDYIFFDARTGLTEVSDILFSNKIDLKVFISACNKQNISGTNSILDLIVKNKKNEDAKHIILRVLSMIPKIDDKIIEQLKSEANIDDDLKLKEKFNWHDVMPIEYNQDIVLNDFNLWEALKETHRYKCQIEDIANKIDDIVSGVMFEL